MNKSSCALHSLLGKWSGWLSLENKTAPVFEARYTVLCQALDKNDNAISGLNIQIFNRDPSKPVEPLDEPGTTDVDGQVVFRFKRSDFTNHQGERGPDLFFKVYRGNTLLEFVLQEIENDNGIIRNFRSQREPIILRVDKHQVVSGVIMQDNGLPAENVTLSVHRFDFGGQSTLLGTPTSDNQGRYALAYQPDSSVVNLEVRMQDPQDITKTISLAKPRFAAPNEILELIAPAVPAGSEYSRLRSDLTKQIGNMTKLAEAKENDEQPDISMLNRATGWDARLITVAVLSERLSNEEYVNLPTDAIYGLIRAGLPSDKQLLAQIPPDDAAKTLTKVRDAGIVDLTDAQIIGFKAAFTDFGTKVRLNIPVPGSRSTYWEVLKASGIPRTDQNKFISVYFNYRGEPDQFWQEVQKAGFDDKQIGKLQLQGKFAFLTGNSTAMIARLMRKNIHNAVEMVERDFHKADTWVKEIFKQAKIPLSRRHHLTNTDKEKLDELIPIAYIAETVENRLHAYSEDMARKIRLSYPTHVFGRLLVTEKNFKLPEAHDATVTLLKDATGQGFRLGETPVSAFISIHQGVTEDNKDIAAQQQLMQLSRVYQLSISNEGMPVLMRLGLTSAHDIMSFSQEGFISTYSKKYYELFGSLPPEPEPLLIYNKSKQVSAVSYNLFTTIKKLDADVPVAGLSAPVDVRDDVRQELIKQFPTLQSLFGSMDFCECEHCRSVLSPAAYLVDLLQFIDPEEKTGNEEKRPWDHFLDEWAENHDYQYTDKYIKPYDAFIERRPDIPHIELSCENTHTAMPYIDIVNEILEYYVAKGKIEKEAANKTGAATSIELLAEPQNVIREAYEKLRAAHYPLELPFDLWLETVREFCNYFETPLDHVLETFRQSDKLFAPTQDFDRFSIFMESLGLSTVELAIFCDKKPLTDHKWHELYGYPADIVIHNPGNAGKATLSVVNSDAVKLQNGLEFTYFNVIANIENDQDTLRIENIGAPDSGGAGRALITLNGLWKLPPKANDLLVCFGLKQLVSAKMLSHRLGVSYKEITDIVKTQFVNPKLTSLTLLYQLDVSIKDARFYIQHKAFYEDNKELIGTTRSALPNNDQQRFDRLFDHVGDTNLSGWDIVNEIEAFEQRLKKMAAEFRVSLNKLQKKTNQIAFDKILVLADPDTGCDFDQTSLQYADGKNADSMTFLRINLFVRLWRKLGWSIEETDRALCAFIPESAPFDGEPANLAKQPFKTALIYISHLKALDEKLNFGKQSRLKLLTLWSDLATTGHKPLYKQLFLNRSVLKSGEVEIVDQKQRFRVSVFDHPLGQYLDSAELTEIAKKVRFEVHLQDVKEAEKIDEKPFAGEKDLDFRYDKFAEVQYLSYLGILSDAEKKRLIALLPNSKELNSLLDKVQEKAKEFKLIKGHILALQGALGLSAEEIVRILEGYDKYLDNAELSLTNISLLYRHKLLAEGLDLTVKELITLKQLSGIDPFKPLHRDPLATIEEDHPFSQTLRFVQITEEIKETGFEIEDLDYLFRHRFDETDKFRSNQEVIQSLLKSLAEGVRAIYAEHPLPLSAGTITEEVLRRKLMLIFPADIVQRVLSMLSGTMELTATVRNVDKKDQLDPQIFADEENILELSYQEAPNKEQKLIFRGALFDAQQAAIISRFEEQLSTEQKQTLTDLLDKVKQQFNTFFDNHLKKHLGPDGSESGFLKKNDFKRLVKPLKLLKPLQEILPNDDPEAIQKKQKENERILEGNERNKQHNQATMQQRRNIIANAFLPYLQQRLSREFIVKTITAYTNTESALVESLLTDKRLLTLPDLSILLNAFAALAEPTITSTFFASFEGFMEVPSTGAYRFFAFLEKKDSEVELRFDHLTEATLKGKAKDDGVEITDAPDKFAELKAGVRYRFKLTLSNLGGSEARLMVQSDTLMKGGVAQLLLYPLDILETAERAVLLLNKVIQLKQSLGVSFREIKYMLTNADKFADINLSTLPTRDAQDALETIAKRLMAVDKNLSKTEAITKARKDNKGLAEEAKRVTQHFSQLLRLAAYIRLKRDLASETDDIIGIFEADDRKDLDTVYPLIAQLTRRDKVLVKATAKALDLNPKFDNEKPLMRLWEALQLVERFGVPVASILEWTRIIKLSNASSQRFKIASDLKEVIKARFEPETWLRVAQPIFDKLRQRQRNALVIHIMHQRSFERMEQLYEYFLIDPGMEPVVQTSRIRLAIASLQLFIQRILLNLELNVHPSTINSKHWEWMKRYRVWEANRKIFLFPENWLEPEFRDDKTHLFTELEGALLQGDVSRDLVEDAFLNYLKKLDELARLDIVAMYIQETQEVTSNTLHVFGRTYSQPHKYFYRRYSRQMWTPWEPVGAEIEGDHLAPVVWRDRLYLFWVTFMDKPDPKGQPGNSIGKDKSGKDKSLADASLTDLMNDVKEVIKNKQIDVQLHWSEYLHGEWSTRESAEMILLSNVSPVNIPIHFNSWESDEVISLSNVSLVPIFGQWSWIPVPVTVPIHFNINEVFIHVSKSIVDNEEKGVFINLSGDSINHAFYLESRNSPPVSTFSAAKPENPFIGPNKEYANRYDSLGGHEFKINFQEISDPGKKTEKELKTILNSGNAYKLTPCDNKLTAIEVPEKAFKGAVFPQAVKETIRKSLEEIHTLMKPVFYQDNQHTFFIEPTVTEQTIEKWQFWVAPTPRVESKAKRLDKLEDYVIPDFPGKNGVKYPPDYIDPIDQRTLINTLTKFDWLLNPATLIEFDGVLIGPSGQPGLKILTGGFNEEVAGYERLTINPGSSHAISNKALVMDKDMFEQSGLIKLSGGLNVVGNSGFNEILANNLSDLNRMNIF